MKLCELCGDYVDKLVRFEGTDMCEDCANDLRDEAEWDDGAEDWDDDDEWDNEILSEAKLR